MGSLAVPSEGQVAIFSMVGGEHVESLKPPCIVKGGTSGGSLESQGGAKSLHPCTWLRQGQKERIRGLEGLSG